MKPNDEVVAPTRISETERRDAVTSQSGPAASSDRLDRLLVNGIAWTGGVKWASQLLAWLASLVIARILSPAAYGISGTAAVYIGFVQLVNEFGLSAAVVQRRDLSEDQIAKLGGLSVLLGVFFTAVSVALSGTIAMFFHEPRLRWVIAALSVTFLASGFQALPRSLMTRDLEFRKLAWLDGIESIVLTVATLALAVLGFGYWALVLGGILSRISVSVVALAWRHHRLSWPAPFAPIADAVGFGGHIALASIAWYWFRSADMAVVQRVMGTDAMGAYTVGFNLASIPVDKLSALIARATPAIFATVQSDLAALRRYVLAITEGITFLTFPAGVGLALVADEFVLLTLGPKWMAAAGPLRLIALAAVFRSIVPLLNQVLVATGRAKRNMQATIATAIVLPILFVVGSRWGTTGVAFVWLAGYPVVTSAFMVRYALAACELSARRYARVFWPALSACAVMAIVVMLLSWLVPAWWPLAVRVAVKGAAGAAAYVGALWFGHGERVRAFLALATRMRN